MLEVEISWLPGNATTMTQVEERCCFPLNSALDKLDKMC